MKKQPVSFFVSYARENAELKKKFMHELELHLDNDKCFEYRIWNDLDLYPGDNWDNAIQQALNDCEFGILMVSLAFLRSQYIQNDELPVYLSHDGKRSFPLCLGPVDFDRHDLKGLEKLQVFRLESDSFKEPRAFSELKPKRRPDFVRDYYIKIHDWLKQHST